MDTGATRIRCRAILGVLMVTLNLRLIRDYERFSAETTAAPAAAACTGGRARFGLVHVPRRGYLGGSDRA